MSEEDPLDPSTWVGQPMGTHNLVWPNKSVRSHNDRIVLIHNALRDAHERGVSSEHIKILENATGVLLSPIYMIVEE